MKKAPSPTKKKKKSRDSYSSDRDGFKFSSGFLYINKTSFKSGSEAERASATFRVSFEWMISEEGNECVWTDATANISTNAVNQ